MAKALTPLMMASLSDETLKSAKILLFSKSGHGNDEKYIVNRALRLIPKVFVPYQEITIMKTT